MSLLYVLGGALIAAACLKSTGWRLRRRPDPADALARAWALYLVAAALIYVGFAIWGGASREWLGVELGGVALYGALAVAGGLRWPAVVGLGWLAHAGWDAALHPGGHPGYVPSWYPPLCLGFDLWIGGWWLWRSRRAPEA